VIGRDARRRVGGAKRPLAVVTFYNTRFEVLRVRVASNAASDA
jgi:hypothetical protein